MPRLLREVGALRDITTVSGVQTSAWPLCSRMCSGSDRGVHISRQRSLGGVDDGLERVRIGDGELSKSTTIEFDAGETQTLHEAVVGDAFSADGGVDALDPQLAEVTLRALRSR